MSHQGQEGGKANKKRKHRQLLEQLPVVPADGTPKPSKQQQQQQQQQDGLGNGNSKFARALGSTDYTTREQGLQALSRWLMHKQQISEVDMLKLWKGLFFCFWHSDKEPVQADLADRLAGLIPKLQPATALLYWTAMLAMLRSEWFAMDRHRINKFLMLVRKFVGGVFARLAADKWSPSSIKSFTVDLPLGQQSLIPVSQTKSLGLSYHLADVWLPELRKAAAQQPLTPEALQLLLQPFAAAVKLSGDMPLINRIRESVFEVLLEDLAAAAAAASPGSSSDDSDEGEEDSSTWMYCQQLDVQQYATLLFDMGADAAVKARNRQALYTISKDLERLAGKRRKTAAAAVAAAGGGVSPAAAVQWQRQPTAEHKGKKKHKQHEHQLESQQQQQQQQQQQGAAAPEVNGLARGSAKKRQHVRLQQQEQLASQAQQHQAPAAPTAANGVHREKKKKKQQHKDDDGSGDASAGRGGASRKSAVVHKSEDVATAAAAAARGGGGDGSSSAGKRRGVVIDLKKNLVFEHGAPPPAPEVRTPPTAKPKGSALKSVSKFDSSYSKAVPATAPQAGQKQQTRRNIVTPSSVPRLKASAFF